MVCFFQSSNELYYAVTTNSDLNKNDFRKLVWLLGNAVFIESETIKGYFIGPRKEIISPFSTNAVEITINMGMSSIDRIEKFRKVEEPNTAFDTMLFKLFTNLTQDIFTLDRQAEPLRFIDNIEEFNLSEGLALTADEIDYLNKLATQYGRKLTDCEVFGFSQVNSEHCRHKIFNGKFIINGKEKKYSLFELIKQTAKHNPGNLVSAYKDNCAFIQGPVIEQFAPERQDMPAYFVIKDIETVLSLKAETHNFPTTVEPFNGAATGSGGEIRDRMAGGKGAITMAGTAVYITSYPRNTFILPGYRETNMARSWLYHSPEEILIKASDGASDFGNKYGQPLICGSLLTFEFINHGFNYAYDKVVMLAGGVGFTNKRDAHKDIPQKDSMIILLGGDNYRIGIGGGAVSSVDTGHYGNKIELNAVQRSNPEMQKRVYNTVRAMTEADKNPVISIHDHGAGGHFNCLSELTEHSGGNIDINSLPLGDKTLSPKEILGNESQERIGLIVEAKDLAYLNKVAERERAPGYVIGQITDDNYFSVIDNDKKNQPVNIKVKDLFGNPPRMIIEDKAIKNSPAELRYLLSEIESYIEQVLQIEAVACKDWLTNKVDRSVTGKVAMQQTAGKLQLPLNNLGVMALDYRGKAGIATSIGHAPGAGIIDAAAGSRLAIAEALTNIVWAPIKDGLDGISLSANWMWPCKNSGEDARLYSAVKAASDFAIKLGINIPTGKDSLSMTQKYTDGSSVLSPGTVIISAVGEVTDIKKIITPVLNENIDSALIYVDFSLGNFELGGGSFAQTLNSLGKTAPNVDNPGYFKCAFNAIQHLIENNKLLAGHDISAGGMLVTLLEMTFASEKGLQIKLSDIMEDDPIKILFSEEPGVIIQVLNKDLPYVCDYLKKTSIGYSVIGKLLFSKKLNIVKDNFNLSLDIDILRDKWFETSYNFDCKQSSKELAHLRYNNYNKQALSFTFNDNFTGQTQQFGIDADRRSPSGVKAAIIREKGVNGDREMAYSLYLAGFDVKDVHMTDLIAGRETLEDINFIVFVGGFSNSDVLGSAKGWAGAFLYNDKARTSLENFYKRKDTLSLGVCNGCQLMTELGLIYPLHKDKPKMLHNDSNKFESAFINVNIQKNNSVMLSTLEGNRLGIWVAHGEGKFNFPMDEKKYNIPMKYSYSEYPGNPNGSSFAAAAICSEDGRHLAMMPHIERAILPWQWAYYDENRKSDEISPWIEAFVNAREWIKNIG